MSDARVLPQLGWLEWAALPTLQIPRLQMKVDTGAKTSSLHAEELKVVDIDGKHFARFLVRTQRGEYHCECPVHDERHMLMTLMPAVSMGCSRLSTAVGRSLTPNTHYQALARQSADAAEGVTFDLRSLMLWTVTQHTAVAVLSLFTGPLADKLGNRAAVRFCVFGSALGPLLAVVLGSMPAETTTKWFWLVFLPLGFTPVTIKMLINYTLELVPREEHPRYVSAIGMCLALPVIFGSPFVGALVGSIGCVPVFAMGTAVILAAGVQTLRLSEPRHSA